MRDRFLRALVLLGAAVWLITELLSGFHAIWPAPLVFSWFVAAAAIAYLLRNDPGAPSRLTQPPPPPQPAQSTQSPACRQPARPPRWGRRFRASSPLTGEFFFIGACLLACAVIVLLTAITALFSPPDSADAMAYHMPRVVYWAQQASVRFFPTNYLNQIMLQPFAEYIMLQSYVLTGGDRLINLGQWFASAASVVAVSCIAREWGAPARGQAVSALFCATIPSGILASSGAKNDYVLAVWLAASVYFALHWRKSGRTQDAALLGCALGLALLTKATAYLFAPWPLLAILLKRTGPIKALPAAGIALACALAINAPQYGRNYAFTGSVLGSDSAFGDRRFRWPNESFGWKQTVSNALRNASEQLGARSDAWNRGVYHFVLAAHQVLGVQPNDPATTWRWSAYAPPRNANHEADAPNRLHLLILLAVACLLTWRAIRGRDRERALYAFSLAVAFLAFCGYLKWQPYMARLFLPLFVLGAPLISTLRPLWIQAALCILLLDSARHPTLDNWVRPLRGPRSVLTTPRNIQYFADMTQWRDDWPAYAESADEIERSHCAVIGIDIANFQLEYPLQALMRQRNPQAKFLHTGVENASNRYRQPTDLTPCAIICLHCAGDTHRLSLYHEFPAVIPEGSFVILERRQ